MKEGEVLKTIQTIKHIVIDYDKFQKVIQTIPCSSLILASYFPSCATFVASFPTERKLEAPGSVLTPDLLLTLSIELCYL